MKIFKLISIIIIIFLKTGNVLSENDIFDVMIISKYKTAFQMFSIIFLLLSTQLFSWNIYFYYLGIFLLWISAIITIYTGLVYFKKSLTILRD